MCKRQIRKDFIFKVIITLIVIFSIVGLFTVQKSLIEGEPLKALGSQNS